MIKLTQNNLKRKKFKLGDLVSWNENGAKWFMIYKTISGKVGLLDTKTWVSIRIFADLIELEEYLEDKNISITKNNDWTIYCP